MIFLKHIVVSESEPPKNLIKENYTPAIKNYFTSNTYDDYHIQPIEYVNINELKILLSTLDITKDMILCISFFRSGHSRFFDILNINNLFFNRFLQKSRKNKLILSEPLECFDYRNFIEHFINPTVWSQVKFLTCNIDIEYGPRYTIPILRFNSFIPYTYNILKNSTQNKYIIDKDFFIPANTIRGTKYIVMHLLNKAGLLEHNYYTYGEYTDLQKEKTNRDSKIFFNDSTQLDTLSDALHNYEVEKHHIEIQETPGSNRYLYLHLNEKLDMYYKSCRIGVVIEDYFLIGKENKFVYHKLFNIVTEKTLNFVFLKKPFVVFQCKNFLRNFRKLGFETFSPFINEDYDDIKDDIERFQAIVLEMQRIANLSEEEKKNLLINLDQRCKHNFSLMSEMHNKNQLIL